ncbi:MAG: Rrf2 family transcriptional regulator [Verrucomicrobia bacterium]|nr:Rrf2 family transcriptional regulator [Verrucomicrobiota bacterium]
MLKLSKKVEYGLMALLHMDGLRRGNLASAKEVSDQYGIPGELLGKVLQCLAKGGVVESTSGAHGGYRLARKLDEMTLGEVIEAIDGPVHIAACSEDPEACRQYGTCNIKEPVTQMQDQLVAYIYNMNLGQFRGKRRLTPVIR